MQAGDIIPGMPKHKINANVTYNLFKDLDITMGLTGATGVYLRGDESNQLKRLLQTSVFNFQSEYTPKNVQFYRIENVLDMTMRLWGF